MEVPISTSELIKAVSVVAEKHKISGTVESNAKAEAVGTGAEQLAGDIVRICQNGEIVCDININFSVSGAVGSCGWNCCWCTHIVLSLRRFVLFYDLKHCTAVNYIKKIWIFLGTPKSITDVINDDLTDEQREELCERIKEAFRKYGLQDLAKLIPLLTTCESFQKVVVTVLVKFLKDELNLPILDNSTAGLLLQISAKQVRHRVP